MKAGNNRLWLALAGSALLLGTHLLGTHSAMAEDVSRWDGDARSAVRLIAGVRPNAVQLRAGIEIRLKRGWHTYWRYPGDSGVPPRFDFKASQNIKDVQVRFPAPQRLVEAGGVSIGYARDVILPLEITPEDAGKPVTLRLKLDYAVCEKLCVPAEAKAELGVSGSRAAMEAALVAAEGRVPKRLAAVAEGTPAPPASESFGRLGIMGGAAAPAAKDATTLAIRSVRREAGPGKPRVVVDVAAPAGATIDLFAEGPTPQWALPVPMPIDGAAAGLRRFAFELDGAPPGAGYDGLVVTLTAVSEREAIEAPFRLD
jgi:Disulphide bond corrector protein DsbC